MDKTSKDSNSSLEKLKNNFTYLSKKNSAAKNEKSYQYSEDKNESLSSPKNSTEHILSDLPSKEIIKDKMEVAASTQKLSLCNAAIEEGELQEQNVKAKKNDDKKKQDMKKHQNDQNLKKTNEIFNTKKDKNKRRSNSNNTTNEPDVKKNYIKEKSKSQITNTKSILAEKLKKEKYEKIRVILKIFFSGAFMSY